jgi:thiol-disulfide isomerase/thioredoxin
LLFIGVLSLVVLGLAGCATTESARGNGTGVGQPAPEFTLGSLAGGQVSLSDFRGQVVLINLWATWCPACKLEIPVLESAYKAHQGNGLVVLGIDIGESADDVRSYLAGAGVTYPVLLDRESVMLVKLRALGLPVSVIVDRNGIARVRHNGELSRSQIEGYVEPLLAEP